MIHADDDDILLPRKPGAVVAYRAARSLVVAGSVHPSSVLCIYITFTLHRDAFQDFTDLIEVYEGGAELKGERVASFRGTDAGLPTNKYGLPEPAGSSICGRPSRTSPR